MRTASVAPAARMVAKRPRPADRSHDGDVTFQTAAGPGRRRCMSIQAGGAGRAAQPAKFRPRTSAFGSGIRRYLLAIGCKCRQRRADHVLAALRANPRPSHSQRAQRPEDAASCGRRRELTRTRGSLLSRLESRSKDVAHAPESCVAWISVMAFGISTTTTRRVRTRRRHSPKITDADTRGGRRPLRRRPAP